MLSKNNRRQTQGNGEEDITEKNFRAQETQNIQTKRAQ